MSTARRAGMSGAASHNGKELAGLMFPQAGMATMLALQTMVTGPRGSGVVAAALLAFAAMFLLAGAMLRRGVASRFWAVVMIAVSGLDLLCRATTILSGAGLATIFIVLGSLMDVGIIVLCSQVLSAPRTVLAAGPAAGENCPACGRWGTFNGFGCGAAMFHRCDVCGYTKAYDEAAASSAG